MPFEPLLTKEQVAELLQVKPSTIYELTRRRNGEPLPKVMVGKYMRFRLSEVNTWLEQQKAA